MFLFETSQFNTVYVCPHCGLALIIYRSESLVKFCEAAELNIYIEGFDATTPGNKAMGRPRKSKD